MDPSVGNADPICVVSMACRLPGGIRSPSDLWNFLAGKKSALAPVPKERLNIEAFYHPDVTLPDMANGNRGYFLNEDVRQFENGFFGIDATEAASMDPQQRKLLELVFECFESVGMSMEDASGKNIGVYVGNSTTNYQTMHNRDLNHHTTTSKACSSSLYSIHSAASALRNGECGGAIVASANLIGFPEQQPGVATTDTPPEVSSFHISDAPADGCGRAEAVNVVFLKPLSSALKNGDKVLAVLRGSSVNANGRTLGVSHLDTKMQEKAIRQAYATEGLKFSDTDYIECHGTGTTVGDPIEMEAVQACFEPRDWPLKVGSVITNLGHSGATSGLTSLIKVAMAFEEGKIPPAYCKEILGAKPEHAKATMNVVMEFEDWPRERRRASINNFSYGGANSHLIVESFDSYLVNSPPKQVSFSSATDQLLVIPVSAASRESRDIRLDQVKKLIQRKDARSIKNLTFTLANRRPSLLVKGFLLAQTEKSGGATLVEADTADNIDDISMGLPLGFVFAGQGAQYHQVGQELLERNKMFRASIKELDTLLSCLPSDIAPTWSIVETILLPPEASQINNVTRNQLVNTAIQIGLVDMLQYWGISPSVVVGHSSGEIAAAYAAGILDVNEAILVAYFRGFSVEELTAEDSMIVSVDDLQKDEIFGSKLDKGRRACYSHVINEVGQIYESLIERYLDENHALRSPAVKMFSSVEYGNGQSVLHANQGRKAKYWRDNLERTVEFGAALTALIDDFKKVHLIEIGPHSTLKGPIQQIREAAGINENHIPYSATLIRGQDAELAMKALVGGLYSYGHKILWQNVNDISPQYQVVVHDLAPYPWNYSAGKSSCF
ncbi:hypothetical protein ABKA04_005476 [Annulohypoxylon sp. FPYF3050]